MKTVEMPKMGDTMEEGRILRWIKQEGDLIKKGEPLAEIETEKVNIEVEAFASGTLRKIMVPAGEVAAVGAPIALIGRLDEALPGNLAGPTTSTPHQAQASVAAIPVESDGQAATALIVPSGVSVEVPSPQANGSAATSQRGRVFISPIARRLAEERQLDYAGLQGSGPNGRIIRLDVEAAVAAREAFAVPTQAFTAPEPAYSPPSYAAASSTTASSYATAPTSVQGDEVTEIPLSAMRRTIAKRLSQSMQTAPHFYVTSVIDTGKLATLRQQINEYTATSPEPLKISFNDLIVRAVAQTLTKMPQINVSFLEDRILQKQRVHVGIAVALEQGLIVPVLRDADRRSVLDIARESRRLVEAARTNRLRPEDFSGGTFTISNLGMYDVESFTAVINPPESAILAIGSITPTPAVVDGQVVVRDRMKVTLSSDHRAIDGAQAARFLQELKHLLEEPFGLFL